MFTLSGRKDAEKQRCLACFDAKPLPLWTPLAVLDCRCQIAGIALSMPQCIFLSLTLTICPRCSCSGQHATHGELVYEGTQVGS